MFTKVRFIIVSILLLLATYNITRTTSEIYESSRRLDDLQQELEAGKKENESLKGELTFRQTAEFIEQEARNKLNFIKPGEKVLIPVNGTEVAGTADFQNIGKTSPQSGSYFMQWVKLFF